MARERSITSPQTETKTLINSYKGEGKNVILAITGTSGAIYGLRMLRALLLNEFNVEIIVSEYGQYTLMGECGIDLSQANVTSIFPDILVVKSTVRFHNNLDLKSEIFSNSFNCFGMVIVPCAMNYISGIANGDCKNLIEKCADYAFAYSKPLVIVPRDTPINKIQLHNMTQIIEAGGKIVPAMPSFEYNPKDFNDLADFVVGRAMDILCFNRMDNA